MSTDPETHPGTDPVALWQGCAQALAEAAAETGTETGLSALGAGLLAAAGLGISGDSRSFARDFGLAHALVLREVTSLVEAGLLTVPRRDARSQRSFFAPSPAGAALLAQSGYEMQNTHPG